MTVTYFCFAAVRVADVPNKFNAAHKPLKRIVVKILHKLRRYMLLASEINLFHIIIIIIIRRKAACNTGGIVIRPIVKALVDKIEIIAKTQIIANKNHILAFGGKLVKPQIILFNDVFAENPCPQMQYLTVEQQRKKRFFSITWLFVKPGSVL